MTIHSQQSFPPSFSALLIHDTGRRNPNMLPPPKTVSKKVQDKGLRIFVFELTDSEKYPEDAIICTKTGRQSSSKKIKQLTENLKNLPKYSRKKLLQLFKKNFFNESGKIRYVIGESEDFRKTRRDILLKESTADLQINPDGSTSIIMDWDKDLTGKPSEFIPTKTTISANA